MTDEISWRWRVAGWLRRVPEFRGRDRLSLLLLAGTQVPDGIHVCTIGPGLTYEAEFRQDGSLAELFFLQYERPALLPVLEAALRPGAAFFDVGANIGVYAGWGARLVGESGEVHAFEPAPIPRASLTSFLARNGLHHVRVVPAAVGEQPGTLTLHTVPNASGLSSAVPQNERPDVVDITVPLLTLDGYVRESKPRSPALIKIDVEGLEFEVLRGCSGLLSCSTPPVVVFETVSHQLEANGTHFDDITRWLQGNGYSAYALTRSGLRLLSGSEGAPLSANTLAVREDRHRDVLQRLASVRFRRNQTC